MQQKVLYHSPTSPETKVKQKNNCEVSPWCSWNSNAFSSCCQNRRVFIKWMSPPSCTAIWPLPPPPRLCPSPTPTPTISTAGMVGHHNRNVNLRDADTRDHHTSHLFSVAGRQSCRGRSLLIRMVEFSFLPDTRGNTIEHTPRVGTASHHQRLSRTTARSSINSIVSPLCM